MMTSTRRSDSFTNSRCLNTELLRGAMTTPTNWDMLDSSCAAFAITFWGCSAARAGVTRLPCCTVSMVSTNRR